MVGCVNSSARAGPSRAAAIVVQIDSLVALDACPRTVKCNAKPLPRTMEPQLKFIKRTGRIKSFITPIVLRNKGQPDNSSKNKPVRRKELQRLPREALMTPKPPLSHSSASLRT